MQEVWRVGAVGVAAVHFGFLGYVAVGGFLAWRWPRAVWAHLAAVGWGLAGIVTPVVCPLTGLQDAFRRWAGEPPLRGGFIDQYIEGVLYPERFTPLLRAVLAAAIVVSWLGALRVRSAGQGVPGGVTGR
ncbi:MAG TPA: DUF2784 domain-containing protein [Mycobacteriales bacterium]|nr:DUF2784 domain-containing protein [Mycobacteriales bacterium]